MGKLPLEERKKYDPKRKRRKDCSGDQEKNRRTYSAEERIRIILEGLREEDSIAEICRREGIHQNMYYKWSRAFLEACKKRLLGETMREANTEKDINKIPLLSVQYFDLGLNTFGFKNDIK